VARGRRIFLVFTAVSFGSVVGGSAWLVTSTY
jgi:hypothetical protein